MGLIPFRLKIMNLRCRQQWAFLDNYRGSFRWHICFNFGIFSLFNWVPMV